MATPSERRREEELRVEYPNLSKIFDGIDTKQTGKLERDEVTEFLQLPTDQAHKAIDHLDVDGDGVVSLHELIRHFKHLEGSVDGDGSDIRTHWAQGAGISSSFSDDTMTNISWKGPHPLTAFAAGAVGGLASRAATAPFDRIRILQQTASGPEGAAIGILRTARDVFQREGVRGFWKGNLANLAKVVPQASIVCVVYTQLLASMGVVELHDRPYLRFASGATSGIVAATVTFPLDVIRTRLAAQMASPQASDWTSRHLHQSSQQSGVKSPLQQWQAHSQMQRASVTIASPTTTPRTVAAGIGLCHSQAAGRAVPSPYGTRGRVARAVDAVGATKSPPSDRHPPSTAARASAVETPKLRVISTPLWRSGSSHAHNPVGAAHADFGMARRSASSLAPISASKSSGSAPSRVASSIRSFVSGSLQRASESARRSKATTRYLGILDAASTIWKAEGVNGFFKGIRPTVVSVAIFVGVQQAGYDLILPLVSASLDVAALSASQASSRALGQAKERLRRAGMRGGPPGRCRDTQTIVTRPAFWHSVVAGGIIGMAAQTLVHPLDTLRRRIQVRQTEWIRPMQAFREVVRSSGMRGLYRGCLAANLKVAPSVAITLCARDAILGRLDWR